MLSPLLFAIIVDVVTEKEKRNGVNELLYADDLVLMSETKKDSKERFLSASKDAPESKSLKVNTGKTKVINANMIGKRTV